MKDQNFYSYCSYEPKTHSVSLSAIELLAYCSKGLRRKKLSQRVDLTSFSAQPNSTGSCKTF